MADIFGEQGEKTTTHLIVFEVINGNSRWFKHVDSESSVIDIIAKTTNDKEKRIYKIYLVNEDGETSELDVVFVLGKLRLITKESAK